MRDPTVILGSRSPRRRELLQLLVPADRIVLKPPRTSEEAGFAGLHHTAEIAARLKEIVQTKQQDVDQQLTDDERRQCIALVADTIIVVTDEDGMPHVLGQPPAEVWQPTVRRWFKECYSGRPHEAWTAVKAWDSAGVRVETIVSTIVTFRELSSAEIEWYLSTGESQGKAGGYALQGLASVFVAQVQGSLTNVVGLPLEILRQVV